MLVEYLTVRVNSRPTYGVLVTVDGTRPNEGAGAETDEALLSGLAAGDSSALSALYDRFGRLSFGLAYRMLADQAAAEDVVQEASFVAWQKVGTMRDPDRLRSWFLGVVANKCRNARRGKWATNVRLGVPDHLAVVSAEEDALRGADLRRAVAGLRQKDRLVVVLYFYLDMPLSEVAAVTGSSLAATRARLYRSIRRLRPGIDLEEALR
jgi:RNA polymerase sigma-70 factor (ECF subfamily)